MRGTEIDDEVRVGFEARGRGAHDGRRPAESDFERQPATAGQVATTIADGHVRRAVSLSGHLEGAKPWSAERPHLYDIVIELIRRGRVQHRVRDTVGFRTIEVRAGTGLFVNGRRVLLKGVNRHSFWPDSGRTLTDALNRRDAELIKELNLNAVRMSHYPPDPAFLDACDELGIYVINELGGWHDAYDSGVGRKLIREMVERDVNHPSIILWANGNEGGHNVALDGWFTELDPQRRTVLRPDSHRAGFETAHYPSYDELRATLDPSTWTNRWRELVGDMPLFMPTEMLHGLYDGGSGAGLEDFWSLLSTSPHGAGGFLWAFTDEAIVRTDRDGELDTDGNHAPDGVLGPYRERTGNFHAVRAAFSPVVAESVIEPFDGRLSIENRYDQTDLSELAFEWETVVLGDLGATLELVAKDAAVAARGSVAGPPVGPGETGEIVIPIPGGSAAAGDAMKVAARDPHGQIVAEWVLPTTELPRSPASEELAGTSVTSVAEAADTTDAARVDVQELGNVVVLSTRQDGRTNHEVSIDAATGRLLVIARSGEAIFEWSTENAGPRLSHDDGSPQRSVRLSKEVHGVTFQLASSTEPSSGPAAIDTIRWTLFPSGWLKLEVASHTNAPFEHHGLVLGLSRERFRQLRYLGNGPYRVWANRQQGGTLGVWTRSDGDPELEGFYSNVHWAEITTDEARLGLYLEDGLFLGLYSPEFPDDARTAIAAVPTFQGVGVYHAIPAIGTKFKRAEELGPQSARLEPGRFDATLWIRAESLQSEDDR